LKKIVLLILFFLVVFYIEAPAESIRFAPIPMLSQATINKMFFPFTQYLSKITGQQVKIVYQEHYSKLLDEFINDEIDLAYLGALPYVILTNQDPDVVPVVRFVDACGQSTYTCSLVTFDRTPGILANSNLLVALTQPFSTCGYLMTEHLLSQRGLILEHTPHYFAGKHSEAALDVIRGKASVAGVKTSIGEQYRKLGLRFIAESPPLPGFLLVANSRTLSVETIDTVRNSLLQLNPRNNPRDAEVTKLWGKSHRYGAVPAYNADYQPIKDMLKQMVIPGVNQ
jgi:phosphonate transport system substrate-binding protein